MKMPIAEIFDRYTIVRLKFERLENGLEIVDQLKIYEEEVDRQINKLGKKGRLMARQLLEKLTEINSTIWELEKDLRDGFENKSSLEQIGKTAIQIRNHNGVRLRTKNEIYSLFIQTIFREIKINHISTTDEKDSYQ